ncbi:MAG: M6 family metalloprotease domain-containing protein [Prevotella sp.]|nr:M6 family metalloprotease domain-containing protein [Prevotella sp.]
MKRITLTTILIAITALTTWAIPAKPGATRVQQPDGTFITVSLHGDEYLHYTTTVDGYSVVRDTLGCYVYAQRVDGQLVATAMRAHDEAERTPQEQAFLQGVSKHLAPAVSQRSAAQWEIEQELRAEARSRSRAPEYDYNQFRGLIILVEFNDKKFAKSDARETIDEMVNKSGYKGYDNTLNGRFTGSVRDYFYDNSMGLFSPQFDVVGPVTVNRSQFYPKGTDNANQLVYDAINAADSLVDYSQYDGDDDGVVDLVYFIFAGIGSNITSNDARLIWPHAGFMWNPEGDYSDWVVSKDDILIYRYACSTERYGSGSWSIPDGIGTICHEFSHVLGLPDFYDTDYEENGQSNHPAEWSVMSGGSYLNNSRTPAGYTLFERYALGFATPELIKEEGSYELSSLGNSNTGYRLNSRVKKEYFLIENRQKTDKWDGYLPGHGMLVFRVDSTHTSPWRNNTVNNNTKHNFFELLRASGGNGAKSSDPFPGTNHVTELNNASTPANLLTWAGEESPFGLADIKEEKGVIRFDVEDVNYLRAIALPDTVDLSPGRSIPLNVACTPSYIVADMVIWSSSDDNVVTINSDGMMTAVNPGEATITATTVNKRQQELKATSHVVISERQRAADIATFNQYEGGTWAELTLRKAQVLQVYDGRVYLRDESGAIVLDDEQTALKPYDKINGYIYGTSERINRIPVIMPGATTFSTVISVTPGEKTDVEPIGVSIDSLDDSHYANLITLKKVRLERVDGGIWAVGHNDRRIKLWNTFKLSKISVPKIIDDKRFDVTGILITSDTNDDIIDELAILVSPVEVAYNPAEDEGQDITDIVSTSGNGISEVYAVNGQRLSTTNGDRRRPGLYIIRKNGKVLKMLR